MNKKIILVGSILAILGVSYYGYKAYNIYNKMCYKIVGSKINNLDINNINLDLKLKLSNNSKDNVKLKKLFLEIFIKDKKISELNKLNKEIINIKGNSNSILPLNLDFSILNLINSGVINLSNISKIKDENILFKGFVSLKVFGIPLKVPLNFNYTINEMTETDETDNSNNIC